MKKCMMCDNLVFDMKFCSDVCRQKAMNEFCANDKSHIKNLSNN